ncbi:MAG: radical SAM family heme chaperone HemW [Deltaproteobacteria bacterium]|nr:radical SAM family heme chaperone HemW [Deltaproteobacteria bacterium]
MSTTLGIYIHIPFCKRKCPYCDFNSFALNPIPEKDYIRSIINELESVIKKEDSIHCKPPDTIDTIYIGGGTPSAISPKYIKEILDKLHKSFKLKSEAEITIEVNPAAVDKDKLKEYKNFGINRLSIGVQSFDNKVLKILGRIHNTEDAVKTYGDARNAGFENIGIDLMFGIPEQTLDMWLTAVEMAISIKPEHISIYGLTIEQDTEFYCMQKKGNLILPDEETYILMYESAIQRLKHAGYIHYEISNFSLPDYESKHNLRYWQGLDYIGIGAGAHSYISSETWGKRFWNEEDVFKYMDKIERHGNAASGMEILTKEKAIREFIFLGLRQVNGINAKRFCERFNLPLTDKYFEVIPDLKKNNLIEADGDIIRLTQRGLALSDAVFTEFFD